MRRNHHTENFEVMICNLKWQNLNLHGKVLLAPFCQKSCQLIIESFRLADAGILLGLAIRVEVTRCTILGAEFLCGGGTQANSFPFFRLVSGLHSTLPPAGATLRLHVLYDPVVRHHLDVGTFFVMLDFLSPELPQDPLLQEKIWLS